MVDLYLMTQKGYEVLRYLLKSNYHSLIGKVISAKDGNLDNDFYLEIKQLCTKNSIPHFEKLQNDIKRSKYSIAISWRWLIKDLDGLIVLHDSLLPKYRGFAPLVNSLKNGEQQIGVTALFASEKADTGDIIFQSSQKIEYPVTIQEAIDKISLNYIEVIDYIFKKIDNNEEIQGFKQNEGEATYSLWLDSDDYLIDWTKSSIYIKRFIDATGYPYACALSSLNGERVRIISAETETDVTIENRKPGKVFGLNEGFPIVVCGSGMIRITKMISDKTGENILPLTKLRIKFTNENTL